MDAVVPAQNAEGAAGHGDVHGVQAVVGAVEGERTALYGQVCGGLDALLRYARIRGSACIAVPAVPAAPAHLAVGGGAHLARAAAGSNGEAAARDKHPALAVLVVSGGRDTVAPSDYGNRAVQHQHGVAPAYAVAACLDLDEPVCDDEIRLALDAVLFAAHGVQRAFAVQAQVVFGVESRADGVVAVRHGGAGSQGVHAAFRQGDDQLVRLLFVYGGAGRRSHGHAVQDQAHLGVLRGFHHDLPVQGAAQQVVARLADGERSVGDIRQVDMHGFTVVPGIRDIFGLIQGAYVRFFAREGGKAQGCQQYRQRGEQTNDLIGLHFRFLLWRSFQAVMLCPAALMHRSASMPRE